MNAHSAVPLSRKGILVQILEERTGKICSSTALQSPVNQLQNTSGGNGYPNKLVERHMEKSDPKFSCVLYPKKIFIAVHFLSENCCRVNTFSSVHLFIFQCAPNPCMLISSLFPTEPCTLTLLIGD